MNRPYMLFDSAIPIVFDGTLAQCFIVKLRNSVHQSRIRNIAPGVLYTFIFRQDQYGGHSFEWPGACINGTAIGQASSAITTQNFLGIDGGVLQSHVAGTWSQT